ncbi:hypothetical protein DFH09DRAFT_1413292 [Mycena vulgaris]|nr:hypothetical protein DFH09DRAFT_1413292 [Mycena vulgaris]
MPFFTFLFAALLSVALANGAESDSTLVSGSTAAEPGFTWCYEPSMGGRCVSATTLPDQCLNVTLTDNDKASSATAHPNSDCTMYNRYNCGTNGETLEILPQAPIDRFSDYKFDNKMGSYRCKWVVKPPTEVTCNIRATGTDGTTYGYLSTVLHHRGFYGSVYASQERALTVTFSYPESTRSRVNLRALNGPTPDSTFPFVGGIVSQSDGLYPGIANYIPLGGTCETAPSDNPRTFSSNNSFSTNTFGGAKNGPTFLESPIWRYDPVTQALTAHWINPDGGEPETHIAIANDFHYGSMLILVGDIAALLRILGGEPLPVIVRPLFYVVPAC